MLALRLMMRKIPQLQESCKKIFLILIITQVVSVNVVQW